MERRDYRLQDIQLSAVARVASFGETGFARLFFEIVWDDSDFARFASYVETGKHACRAVAPSGAEAETPGSTNRELGNW